MGCAGAECNPAELAYSYFFLANSYDKLFRPTKRGDAENDAYMTKAIQFYLKASEACPTQSIGNGRCSTWPSRMARKSSTSRRRPSRSSSG